MTDRSREGDQETAGGVGPEVPQRPVRRRFDAAYKLRILEEADRSGSTGSAVAAGRVLFVPSVDVAAATRAGHPFGADAEAAWSQSETQELVGRRTGEVATREPAVERSTSPGGVGHRRSKKVSEMLDIPLKNRDDEKVD